MEPLLKMISSEEVKEHYSLADASNDGHKYV